ncbi:MAG: hypothetical protein HY367_01445 [Candidatus Aenigmarchaeota archaeon]|nr:hypothetical protein [Candidatus Aenigmarchaeota archaeon]
MDFAIKVLVIIALAMIGFVVFASIIGGFGVRTGSMLDGLINFFNEKVPLGGGGTGGGGGGSGTGNVAPFDGGEVLVPNSRLGGSK